MPSASGWPIQNETAATAGTVSPMHATALPSARLMLDCSRFCAAARIAAALSGISTMAATMTPTIAIGAPTACDALAQRGCQGFRQHHDRRQRHHHQPEGAPRHAARGAGMPGRTALSPTGRK